MPSDSENSNRQRYNDKSNVQELVRRLHVKNSRLGRRRLEAGRLKSRALLKGPEPKFGNDQVNQHASIEHFTGTKSTG